VAESATAFKKLKIVHAGTFYGGRSPAVLIRALHNVLKQSPQLRGRIEINLVGNTRREDQNLVRKLGLQNEVNFLGYLEHHVCSKHLLEADVLWFVLDNDFQSPGKLYEYFGAKKPILASIVDGYMKQLVLESKAAFCVPLNDLEAHARALLDLMKLFDERKLPKPSDEFVDRFDRRMLTGELAKVLETLMDIDHHAFVKVGAENAG
jgi:glycosyltransferase involved in cell wall biosynthesis